MKRVVVLLSGSGSNLQAILNQLHAKKESTGIDLVAVLANKADAFGLERAKMANIPTVVVPSKGISNRSLYDVTLMAEIDRFAPDLIVLAGFMRILTPEFVAHYQGKMINIHPSLLPKYTGLNTHQRAIDAGDKEHGVSVHFVTEELDGGPVILQARVPVFADDDAATLAQRVLVQEHQIYPQVIRWFCDDRLAMQNGQAVLDGAVLPPTGFVL